ncbi:MAG: hypothetical protein ACRD2J_03075 [Thermoanaerobaculia bacterium]
MSYWDHIHHHTDVARMWMNHPLVRAQINNDISGDPNVWPIDWFADAFRERLPIQQAVSVGSGVGRLERVLVQRGIVTVSLPA